MTDDELRDLGEDIRQHGQRIPITTFLDQEGAELLLDGRSRLDAMERVGLSVVRDGELNRDQVDIQSIPGNVDPFNWVVSANIHRRHLTSEQKREVIEKLLKAKPDQSNRTIAKQVKADDKTVGKVRKRLESRAEIPHVKTRTDNKGRKQPAKKEQKPRESESSHVVFVPSTECAIEAEAPVTAPEEQTQASDEDAALVTKLNEYFNALWAWCEPAFNWPVLNPSRQRRRQKALERLRIVWSDLAELATPAKPRGRPRKVKA
jgi:hypothetical protein